jgi:hypothetical protein
MKAASGSISKSPRDGALEPPSSDADGVSKSAGFVAAGRLDLRSDAPATLPPDLIMLVP